MNSAILRVLISFCLCILFFSAWQQIEAKPRNVIWSMLRVAEEIPPESLVPHRRVKRIRRDAFDGASNQGPEFRNASERVKKYFSVWDDAQGEPLLN